MRSALNAIEAHSEHTAMVGDRGACARTTAMRSFGPAERFGVTLPDEMGVLVALRVGVLVLRESGCCRSVRGAVARRLGGDPVCP